MLFLICSVCSEHFHFRICLTENQNSLRCRWSWCRSRKSHYIIYIYIKLIYIYIIHNLCWDCSCSSAWIDRCCERRLVLTYKLWIQQPWKLISLPFCWQSVGNTMKIITTATTMKRMRKLSMRMTWRVMMTMFSKKTETTSKITWSARNQCGMSPELHPFLLKMLLVQLVLLVILVLLVPSFPPPRPFRHHHHSQPIEISEARHLKDVLAEHDSPLAMYMLRRS